jgi:hypothetical protein
MPIRVFSKYIQHWLFIGISKQQFIVSWKNKWDIVPPIVAPVNGAFTVLADNPRAPQIFERGNTIGVEFHMMELYPDTILTLNNFVKYQNTRMQVCCFSDFSTLHIVNRRLLFVCCFPDGRVVAQ